MVIGKILNELGNNLENKFGDNFTGLVLFGSYARGTYKKNSDIDILIAFKELPEDRLLRLKMVEEILNILEDKYKIPINPIIINQENIQKTYLMADIADYAKIIIDKEDKIKNLFDNIKNDYNKGLIKKRNVGDHYMLWMSDEIET
jgi:predicted nucleotidyltransferase